MKDPAKERAPLPPGLSAELACILEVSAAKPGNVTPARGFENCLHVDFLLAAAAIGRALESAREDGVGAAALECVERTRALVGGNPNLGLILLLAPLAAAAGDGPLTRGRVEEVLARLTPRDGDRIYQAIRFAAPGGLGAASEEDVRSGPPSRPLIEAMALAADRDLVARQYSNGFREVFEEGLPHLRDGLARGLPLEPAIVRCHLSLMARHPDSLIARKCGTDCARESAARAEAVLAREWPAPGAEAAMENLDRWLRADGNRRNPGATADLVGASLFLCIHNGIIQFPLTRSRWQAKSTGCG